MDIEIPKMSVEILGSLPTYIPVFSTANASLTASFTVVTRSSWGKESHCVRGGGEEGGTGVKEEKKRKEEERRGRSQPKRKGRKWKKRRDGDGRKGKRRVVKNVKLLNPSQHTTHFTHKGSVDGIHKSLLGQF